MVLFTSDVYKFGGASPAVRVNLSTAMVDGLIFFFGSDFSVRVREGRGGERDKGEIMDV